MKKAFVLALVATILCGTLSVGASFLENGGLVENTSSDQIGVSLNDIIKDENIVYYDESIVQYQQKTLLSKSRGIQDEASYALDVVTVFSADDMNTPAEMLNLARASFDKGGQASDSSYTVTLYGRIYYNTTTVGGVLAYSLTKVTGNYTTAGLNGTTITGQTVTIGQKGHNAPMNQEKTYNYSASTTSFSLTPPSNWVPATTSPLSGTGMTYRMDLQRPSGSTWSAQLEIQA